MADVQPVVEKKPWQSKTIWMGIIVAIAPLIPVVNDFVKGSPEMVGVILGAVFSLLRLISKDKIVID